MNTQWVGSHLVLSRLPIWASSVGLYAVTLGALFVVRDVFEGLPYQVAYSALLGDAALGAAVLVGATVLHRGEPLPSLYSCGYFHALAALVSVAFGVSWWFLDRPSHWGDIYHHLVIAPLIFYLASTLLPVIVINGTKTERICALSCVVIWASLIGFDVTHERMNQRQWLERHGVTFRQ